MKWSKRILFGLGSLFAVAVLGLVVVPPSQVHALAAKTVARALRDARSVTVTELVPYDEFTGDRVVWRELILHSVTASPEQVSQLLDATGGFFDYGRSVHYRCFEPHHRIAVVRADGSTFRLDVCFICSGFSFDGHGVQPLPVLWASRLRHFFTALGMPPRTLEEYMKLVPKPQSPLS